jgi:hypothetical protein
MLCIICYISVLTQYSAGMIYSRVEENPRAELEDPKSVPFNVDVAYASVGGSPHGRYVKILIVFC